MRFHFIDKQKKAFSVKKLCTVVKVSQSGFYRYIKEKQNKVIPVEFGLISKVREIHKRIKGKYGSRRMSKQLKLEGYPVGRDKARNLMRKAGVSYRFKKKYKITTDSNHSYPVAPNLLNREFITSKPNSVWCSDLTYLWTKKGWMHLAVVIDLYSRKVVGWALADHMKTELVTEALTSAFFKRKPEAGLIHHSDRGSQYASYKYQQLISKYKMQSSMSRKGDCWDNAVVESFFKSLKTELTGDKTYLSKEELRKDITEYIEMFYNSQRLHSTIGYLSPNQYEQKSIPREA